MRHAAPRSHPHADRAAAEVLHFRSYARLHACVCESSLPWATFSATAACEYSNTSTHTAYPARAGTAAVTVTAPTSIACGQANGTVVTHGANISANETWAGDGITLLVPTSIAISGNAIVTVQPCAI